MAAKKAKTQKPAPEPVSSRMIDKSSFVFGILVGTIIIILLVFASLLIQPIQVLLSPASTEQEAPSGVEVLGDSRLPNTFQLVLKNYEQNPVTITGLEIGNQSYNFTLDMQPVEVRLITIAPPECSEEEPYNCPVVIRYVEQEQNQTSSGGGNQSTPTEPLAIATVELLTGKRDVDYSYQLSATGGTGVYAWSASGLPNDLSITTTGLVSGVALEGGTFTVRVAVSDGLSSASVDMLLELEE